MKWIERNWCHVVYWLIITYLIGVILVRNYWAKLAYELIINGV